MKIYILQIIDKGCDCDWQTLRIYNSNGFNQAKLDFEMFDGSTIVESCLIELEMASIGVVNFRADGNVIMTTIKD